jgi:PBP1b-binding outer membrane lipoprotein LpoB
MNTRTFALSSIILVAIILAGCQAQMIPATGSQALNSQNTNPQPVEPLPQNNQPVNPPGQLPQPGNPGPIQPLPNQPQPNQPQPGQLQPVQPLSNQQQPGQPIPMQTQPGMPQSNNQPSGNTTEAKILSFTASRTSINSGECVNLNWSVQGGFNATLNDQPVEKTGQQQVCPSGTTTYSLKLDAGTQMLHQEISINVAAPVNPPNPGNNTTSGGNNSGNSSGNNSGNNTNTQRNVDLSVNNIYPDSNGHVQATIRNIGNVAVSGSYKLVCTGNYVDATGNHALPLKSQYPNINLAPDTKVDIDTGFSRNPSISSMSVTCTLTPPAEDSNSSNNSRAAKVK